ncbi:hypothetical protein B4U80_13508 [Leptotrombidium deliense]|uniref:AB hydrolase-1 domain-containing protein n=1 Tax=Leptotrombidium deliense TaxID=299467 RepID=A0A443S5B6_9ACAR|nr:hypothetical protein B4U80_13508 [Leptotrombidium deliense]
MGFALVMFGYDCWFLQVRGAVESTGHKTLNSNGRAYWRFTTDEIAAYDLPATINYILSVAGKANLTLIGHSQAAKISLQMLSTKTDYQQKIDKLIYIAPVARLGHTKAIFYRSLFPLLINSFLYFYGGPVPDVISPLAPFTRNIAIGKIIWELLNLSIYGPVAPVDPKRIQVYISHIGGASMWNLVNLVRDADKCISYFDYGRVQNLKRYNSVNAPLYDIRKVDTKMVFIIGKNDFTTAKEDVDCIRTKVKNIVAEKPFENMNHLNLIFGPRACEVTKYILEQLQ